MAFRVSADELKVFGAQARAAGPSMTRGLRRGVAAAGELVAVDARARASWSTRIPGSISSRPKGVVAVVSAGGPAAPDAAPYEHHGVGGSFRHPVFPGPDRATWNWTAKNSIAKPFLHPALLENAEAAAGLIVGAVVDAGLVGIA